MRLEFQISNLLFLQNSKIRKIILQSLKETLNSFKSDIWTFDGFQIKPFWKLEILQKLLILKVFFT